MTGFLRNFLRLEILSERSIKAVKFQAERKAIELGMLGLVSEPCSILALLPEYGNTPSAGVISNEAQFFFEAIDRAPEGFERPSKEELKNLEEESLRNIPYIPEEVNIVNGSEEDFQILQNWIRELESDEKISWALDATTGYQAMRLSGSLVGLLDLALTLDKTVEADEIMARIAGRIHANRQSHYLSELGKAWGKYLVSGWLRDKLGVSEDDLKKYAALIHRTTQKRLEEGTLKPAEEFKHKSIEEMLNELDKNTMKFKVKFEEMLYDWGDSEVEKDDVEVENDERPPPNQQKYTAPDTILRAPTTAEQIAVVESNLGRQLPDDLRHFYTITNGTHPVIQGSQYCTLKNCLPKVQNLFWEEAEYMADYEFDLLPDAKLPVPINWPGIEGGAIAMYEHDGQGTNYLWYIKGELLDKARKALDDGYEKANEMERKSFDGLVKEYHGSWEQLRSLQGCWYQQEWGSPEGMFIFHDFKDYLSLVLFESIFEEDKSPLKALGKED